MKQNNKSVDAAFGFLCQRMPSDYEMEHTMYVGLLMDFQDKKGDEAIEGLAGFYLWAIRNKQGDECTRAIVSTFTHDLNGRNEPANLPRSDSYIEVWGEEHNKYSN